MIECSALVNAFNPSSRLGREKKIGEEGEEGDGAEKGETDLPCSVGLHLVTCIPRQNTSSGTTKTHAGGA